MIVPDFRILNSDIIYLLFCSKDNHLSILSWEYNVYNRILAVLQFEFLDFSTFNYALFLRKKLVRFA